jgi:D-alanyl-D-alanine carboxypeptidase
MGANLETVLDAALAKGIPGISAAVATSRGVVWAGTAGVADVQSGEPLRADMLLGIGSITKTFVAVVILQMVEEGRLRLTDTAAAILGSVVKGVPNADQATVQQLLNHTGGVTSWEDDPVWIREGRGASLTVERVWGKEDPLAYVKGHAPLAAPGAKFAYSNTGYTLLGLILERVADADAVSEIRRRILDPLELQDIYLEGFEPVPLHRLPRRYHWATAEFHRAAGVHTSFPEVRPGLIDASSPNLSVEWTAGGMLATARDLVRYGVGLRNGRLLNPASMALMTSWLPVGNGIHIGHNLFRKEYPGGLAVIGHDGGVLGFSASLYWIEGADAVVAVLCNVGSMHSGEVAGTPRLIGKEPELIQAALRIARASH